MDDFIAPGANAFIGGQLQALGHRFIHADNPMLFVENGDQVRDRIESPLPFFLCPDDRFLEPFTLSGVAEISDESVCLSGRTKLRNISSLEKLVFAARIPKQSFK